MVNDEDEYVSFLFSKENIREARQVAQLVPMLEGRLREKYWRGMVEKLRGHLEGVPEWVADVQNINKSWSAVLVQPVSRQNPHYRVAIEADADQNNRLAYGVTFSEKQQRDLQAVAALHAELNEAAPDGGSPGEEWWLAWWNTNTWLGSDEFYQRMAQEPDQLIAEHADLLWSLFAKHKAKLDQINKILAASGL